MNWPIVSLRELAISNGQYGLGSPSREFRAGDPRYVRITDIRENGQLSADVVAPDCGASDWKKALLKEGDLLFARSGATVGKTYLHPAGDTPTVYAGYLIRFQLNPDRVFPKFIYHYTKSLAYSAWVASTQRTVAQPNINAKQYAELPVPVPPLDEQRRIAAILDHSDRLCQRCQLVIERLEGLSQAIFHGMFGDLAPSSSDQYPVIPLGKWIDPARPITYGILKPGSDIEGGVPYVRVADMRQGGIELCGIRRTTREIANAYRRSQLLPGDLLMSIRGHVGRFAFVPGQLAGGNITQDSARLAVAESKSTEYVRAALETPRLQQWMARRTKGAAVRGINLGDLREAPIPAPPLEAQAIFAERVTATASKLETARRQLEACEALLASLQSRAFTEQL